MRRFALALLLLIALAFPASAAAFPGENRNDSGFGGGPHCHTIVGSGRLVFPSHKAHLAQIAHRPAGPLFGAATCPS